MFRIGFLIRNYVFFFAVTTSNFYFDHLTFGVRENVHQSHIGGHILMVRILCLKETPTVMLVTVNDALH